MHRAISHPSYVPVRGLGCGCALKGTEPSLPVTGKLVGIATGLGLGALVFHVGRKYGGARGVLSGCLSLGVLASYYAIESGFYQAQCVQQQIKPSELVNT